MKNTFHYIQGYTITTDKNKADLWLLNSCTVKNPAEEHFKNQVNLGLKQDKKVVVAGCVPQVITVIGILYPRFGSSIFSSHISFHGSFFVCCMKYLIQDATSIIEILLYINKNH